MAIDRSCIAFLLLEATVAFKKKSLALSSWACDKGVKRQDRGKGYGTIQDK